jgi:peptidoglycan/LPS O-acetylase OafA/YrhL
VTESQPQRFHLPELDLLRFFAFMLVFLSHAVPGDEQYYSQLSIPSPIAKSVIALAAGGAWGVDLFFTLSSYLITTLLLREKAVRGTIDVQAFYLRRALRIWPLYFGFLLGVVPLLHWASAGGMSSSYMLAFALFVGNWACVWWGYPHSVATPLWSVSIEEQFYLSWPLIVRRCHSDLIIVVCAMLFIAFVTRGWLTANGVEHPKIWCDTFARLDPIAAGALVAVVTQKRKLFLSKSLRLTLFLAAVITLSILGRFGDFVGNRALMTYPAASLACAAMLIATIGVRLPASSWRVQSGCYLGRISYGLYIFHPMFLSMFDVANTQDSGMRLIRTAAAFSTTATVAALSYHFFELRFLRLKQRFERITSVLA